jgi:hypothetical protein
MREPTVPLLLVSLGVTALLLGSGFLLRGPEVAPTAPHRSVASFALEPPSPTSPDLGASAVEAASQSLAAGLGPATVPWGSTNGAPNPFLTVPNWFPSMPGGPPRPSSGGWHLLGSLEGRYAGAMAYDASDGYVLEFGGVPDSASTWTFANGTWTNRTGSVTGAPPLRAAASMAYDPSLDEIVMFGGFGEFPNGTDRELNDTWTYHAGSWTNVTGSAGPAPAARGFGGFAYDPNDSADVLFGGDLANGVANDTWEFAAGHWKNVTANQSAIPFVDGPPDLAEDGTDGDVVMLAGGNASYPFGNQTWTFTGNHWGNVTSSAGPAPSPRTGEAETMDSTGGGVVLFGGYGASTTDSVGLTDSWRFVHGSWSRIASGSPAPSPRVYEVMTDDPGGSGVLLYGGVDEFNETFYVDTWTLSGGQWDLVNAGASPNPRTATTMAFDSTSDQVILFGGSGLNDTWSFAHGSWTVLHPSRSPPGRLGATLANDPSDDGLVLFGGEAIVGGLTPVTVYNDTWVWANGTWTNLTATAGGPPARVFASSVYDSSADVVVLYGGSNFGDFHDTWTFHSGRWSAVNTSGPTPGASVAVGLADDPSDSGVLLFGGEGTGPQCHLFDSVCNDTWTFSNGTWTDRTSSDSPAGRASEGLSYDPSIRADLLYGGIGSECHSTGPNSSECESTQENDTWSYAGGHWTNLTGSLGPPPASGIGYAMVDDATDGYLLLVGSYQGEVDEVGTGSWWSLTLGSSSGPLTVGAPTASADPGVVGHSTILSVEVSGGLPPYEIVWNGLPTGCASANSSSVLCSPSQANTYLVTVRVTDALADSVTGPALTLNVTATPPVLGSVSIAPATPTVAVGGMVSLSAQAFDTGDQSLPGATFSWSILPADLASLNATTGPDVRVTAHESAGTLAVQASATWDGSTVDAGVSVTIFAATGVPLALGSFTVSPTTVAVGSAAVFTTVAGGGTAPYTFDYTGLPTGCASGNVANLSCTPSASGSYVVEVHVSDFAGAVRTGNATLTVAAAGGSPSGGLTAPEWIGIGALVVVVLAVATVVLVRGRRRPPSPADAGSPGPDPPT